MASRSEEDSLSENEGRGISSRQAGVLGASVIVIAGCGMVYELSIATVSSYLLGNSVYQFSITIGLFMAAMGAGALASKAVKRSLLPVFIAAEAMLALIGGLSSVLLFMVFPYSGLYGLIMYGLIGATGGLVGLEIPIIVRFLSEHGGVRRGVADALSLDYLGALVGSVAFPILMLPHLGLLRTSFAVGLLNGAVGIAAAVAFRNRLARSGAWAGGCAAVCVVLCVCFALHERLQRYAEKGLYGGRIVLRHQTPYQRIIMTVDRLTQEHRLYLDGHIQFAEFDEYRYHEALVHPVMAVEGSRARVLVLGGGDGLAAREALGFTGVESLTLVDLDPAVTDLARSFPALVRLNGGSLDDSRVRVINEDAFSFVQESEETFDRVIIDLPDPHNEALSKLYSREFYRMLRARMPAGGALAVQSSSPFFTPEVYGSIGQTLESAGFGVVSYHVDVPAFGPWGFHLGLAGEGESEFAWRPDARFMSAGVFAAARVFPEDLALERPSVNTVFEPRLYRWYRQGVERGRPKRRE